VSRPSNRARRRAELVQAFAQVLADHGYAGATMVAVAERAGVSPGLLHYHFRDKAEMLSELVEHLARRFATRAPPEAGVAGWIEGALSLEAPDLVAARCWVGVLGESLREPALFARVGRLLGDEARALRARSGGALSQEEAVALLSFAVGYLVVGAFRPDLTAGGAARQVARFARLLRAG
jgi:TetR/AcrR family transcriptional repressor of bet genes